MAQLNITLNQDEILLLLAKNSGEAFKKLLQESLNGVLQAESAEQLGAAPYERTTERTDSRNGFRERDLNTRIGRITLKVPRHREQPFKTMIFENYSRSEAALIAGMAEMVVNGVSTRKVSQVMETLCGTGYSKSTVSELCKELDKPVKEFQNRPLKEQTQVSEFLKNVKRLSEYACIVFFVHSYPTRNEEKLINFLKIELVTNASSSFIIFNVD